MITQQLYEAMLPPAPTAGEGLADFNDRQAWNWFELVLWRSMWATAILYRSAF